MPETPRDPEAVAASIREQILDLYGKLQGHITPELAKRLLAKLEGREEEFVLAVEQTYDLLIEPMNLPGPDTLLDPLIRLALGRVASTAYQNLMAWLKAQAEEQNNV